MTRARLQGEAMAAGRKVTFETSPGDRGPATSIDCQTATGSEEVTVGIEISEELHRSIAAYGSDPAGYQQRYAKVDVAALLTGTR